MFKPYFLKSEIRVLSFDFDGCLANPSYLTSKNIIESNKPFLNKIKTDNKKFTAVITFIGSLRQSIGNDILSIYLNKKKIGSCFPAIKKVSDFLDTSFDPFLLADIEGSLEAGSSFSHALGILNGSNHYCFPLPSNITHNKCDTDKSKVVILYAQIHKVANKNPEKIISFDFYDDKMNVLSDLNFFFNTNPNMIPQNVTLHLNLYKGKDPSIQAEITGTGNVDANYRRTVTDMLDQAIIKNAYSYCILNKYLDCGIIENLQTMHYSTSAFIKAINVAVSVDPTLLMNRKPLVLASDLSGIKQPITQYSVSDTASTVVNSFSFFTLLDNETLDSTVNELSSAFDHSLKFDNEPRSISHK